MRSPDDTWQRACDAALSCTDPAQLFGLVELAIMTLEARYAEWGENPGTDEELAAIRQSTSQLQQRLAQYYRVNDGAA